VRTWHEIGTTQSTSYTATGLTAVSSYHIAVFARNS
jgi:hypothetical protein